MQMGSPNQSNHLSDKRTQMTNICKQAGTGPSHIQGSKIAKGLLSVNLLEIRRTKKMDRVGGGGDTSEIVNIFDVVEGRTLRRKKHF